MKMQDVREIGKRWGVDVKVGRSKQDIIRDIQTREGYSPCFKTRDTCVYTDCSWRNGCLKEK